VADHIYEDGRHIGYIENGFAFDHHGKKRYRFEHSKLRDLNTGQVVGYLNAAGMPGDQKGIVRLNGFFPRRIRSALSSLRLPPRRGANRSPARAMIIGAVRQQTADAGVAHLRDFLRAGASRH
jgi:hypothetical protein